MQNKDDLFWVDKADHINYKILWPLAGIGVLLTILLHVMPG